MSREQLLVAVATADPQTLARIEQALNPANTSPIGGKLLTVADTARQIGLSRSSITRLIKEKRLATVETRRGRVRIPQSAIADFMAGKGRSE
jgi:excisionase family DNA binding protein